MKLTALLKIHSAERHKLGISEILGDSYLLNHNQVYANVRKLVVEKGFTFVEAWPGYYMMLLLQLPMILKTKKIPYGSLTGELNMLSRKLPSGFSVEDLPDMNRSYHFHESCHCIAEELLPKKNSSKNLRLRATRIMMSESFANTCEAIAIAQSPDGIHKFLARQNSAYFFGDEADKLVLDMLSEFTYADAFTLIFYFNMYSSFLYVKMARSELSEVLKNIFSNRRLNGRQMELCVKLFSMLENVNSAFQFQTAHTYFNFIGFRGSIQKILKFDFLDLIRKNPAYFQTVQKMAELIQNGDWNQAIKKL